MGQKEKNRVKQHNRLKEQIQQISNTLTDNDTQKIVDLLEKEVLKVEKKMLITMEIKDMVEYYMEDEFEEDEDGRTIH